MSQGSVLCPIFFFIYVNDVSNCSNFETRLYADDSILTMSYKVVNCLQNIINCELPKINAWLKSNHQTLNIDKTKYLLFTKSKQKIAAQINDSKIQSICERI